MTLFIRIILVLKKFFVNGDSGISSIMYVMKHKDSSMVPDLPIANSSTPYTTSTGPPISIFVSL